MKVMDGDVCGTKDIGGLIWPFYLRISELYQVKYCYSFSSSSSTFETMIILSDFLFFMFLLVKWAFLFNKLNNNSKPQRVGK